jgi:hypothetical protein
MVEVGDDDADTLILQNCDCILKGIKSNLTHHFILVLSVGIKRSSDTQKIKISGTARLWGFLVIKEGQHKYHRSHHRTETRP